MKARAVGKGRFAASGIATVLALAALAIVPVAARASTTEHVYVTTLSSGLFAYDIGSGGGLTPLQGSPFPAGNGGFGVTATPDRRHLYVANYGSNGIAGFDIAGGGSPTKLPSSPFASPLPFLPAVTPDERYLYVANDATESDPGSVSGYAIDSGSGNLTPVPGSPVAASDTGPFGAAVSPDGRYLYISNTGDSPNQPGSVSAYRIAAETGALSELTGSPYEVGIAAAGVVLTPDGTRLYVANLESDTISAFERDADTGLLTALAGSPFPTSTGEPNGMAITPDGNHLYVAVGSMITPSDNVVDAFRISRSGALAPVTGSPYPAGLGPQFGAISGDGTSLYVTNNGSQDVSGYAIDPESGELTELSGSPFATGANPLGITIPHAPSRDFSFGNSKPYGRAKAKLTLHLPGPGRVSIAGDGVRKRRRHFRALERQMIVGAKGKERRQLLRHGHISLEVKTTFTPDGGSPKTKTERVRLVKR